MDRSDKGNKESPSAPTKVEKQQGAQSIATLNVDQRSTVFQVNVPKQHHDAIRMMCAPVSEQHPFYQNTFNNSHLMGSDGLALINMDKDWALYDDDVPYIDENDASNFENITGMSMLSQQTEARQVDGEDLNVTIADPKAKEKAVVSTVDDFEGSVKVNVAIKGFDSLSVADHPQNIQQQNDDQRQKLIRELSDRRRDAMGMFADGGSYEYAQTDAPTSSNLSAGAEPGSSNLTHAGGLQLSVTSLTQVPSNRDEVQGTTSTTDRSEAGQFPRYRELANELQIQVWKECCRQDRRTHKLFFDRQGMSIESDPRSKVLSIQHVCHLSREMAEKCLHKVGYRTLNMDTSVFYVANTTQSSINPIQSQGIVSQIERFATIFPPFAPEAVTRDPMGNYIPKSRLRRTLGHYRRFEIISIDPTMEGFLAKIKHVALNLENPYDGFFDLNNYISETSVKMAFKVYLGRLCRSQFLGSTSEYETLDIVILKDWQHATYNDVMSEIGSDGEPIRDTVFANWKVKEAEADARIQADAERTVDTLLRLPRWTSANTDVNAAAVEEEIQIFRECVIRKHIVFASNQWVYPYTPRVLRLFEEAAAELLAEDESDGKSINKPKVINLVVRG